MSLREWRASVWLATLGKLDANSPRLAIKFRANTNRALHVNWSKSIVGAKMGFGWHVKEATQKRERERGEELGGRRRGAADPVGGQIVWMRRHALALSLTLVGLLVGQRQTGRRLASWGSNKLAAKGGQSESAWWIRSRKFERDSQGLSSAHLRRLMGFEAFNWLEPQWN